MIELFTKYKGIISYLFFGVCTTIVNIISYYICARQLELSTVASTVIAWLLSVLFAYVTNKQFVFESKSWKKEIILKEMFSFFVCRLATGMLDLVIMVIGVDVIHFYDVGVKIFSNLLVIILNYIANKMIIFQNKETLQEDH
ncbi:MAG: GtrA family protein [Lachnospiraceae bacterium]|nr:GtrA family protein [Lachnospiraceae bacterium]